MEPQVIIAESNIDARLSQLGLDQAVLWDVVRRSELAYRSSSPNHPPLYAGFVAWGEAVRGLRDVLATRGWTRCDENNYSLCVSPSEDVAIAVATGNDGTGQAGMTPSTKSPKGPSTVDAIAVNQLQFGLPFPDATPVVATRPGEPEQQRATWLLLIHRAGHEVRCELSLPLSVSADGRPDRWKERIILGVFKGDSDIDVSQPEMPVVDIEIKRKA